MDTRLVTRPGLVKATAGRLQSVSSCESTNFGGEQIDDSTHVSGSCGSPSSWTDFTSGERTCDVRGMKYGRMNGTRAFSTASICGTLIFLLIILVEFLVPLVFRTHQEPLLHWLPMRFHPFRQIRIACRATAPTAYVCVVTWLGVETTHYRLVCRRISQ